MKKITLFALSAGFTALLWGGSFGKISVYNNQWSNKAEAQEKPERLPERSMTVAQLEAILEQEANNLRSQNGQLSFDFNGRSMILLTNEQYDRMRIVAPIIESERLTEEELQKMLIANFHNALDARYAISDGIVFATFIHPLSSLHRDDFRFALRQVAELANTFGTTYSSGGLLFLPGGSGQENFNEERNIQI